MRSLLFGIGICLLLNLDLFKFKGLSKYFNYKKFTTWVKEAIKLYHFMIRQKVKNNLPFRLWHQKSLLYYLLFWLLSQTLGRPRGFTSRWTWWRQWYQNIWLVVFRSWWNSWTIIGCKQCHIFTFNTISLYSIWIWCTFRLDGIHFCFFLVVKWLKYCKYGNKYWSINPK